MCGLAVFFGSQGPDLTRKSLEAMLHIQTHRGPDSTGAWCGTVHGTDIGLGLCRLKILDLSDVANQPMVSPDGRFVLVYNGEIYNYIELREELSASGVCFRTHGDTEVVLESLILWGPAALNRFNGMWSLALLDRSEGQLMLSRDRFGIKPLYTYADGRRFYASSEIKSILAAANTRFQVTPSVAHAYLHQGLLCTGPATFFKGIEEFPAGHWTVMPVDEVSKKHFTPVRYWTSPAIAPTDCSENQVIDLVRTTFIDSVKLRLRSDVPVGVLLSGGIDSSAIAAAVHHIDASRDDIKLISAVGQNQSVDEQPFIDMLANHLHRRVDKVTLDYPSSEALDMITQATWFNDEPIGSFSTVAHHLLMKRARELGITVLLSGQGADELLCGYMKYLGFYLQGLIRSGHLLTAVKVFSTFTKRGTVVSQLTYQEAKRYLPRWLRLPEIDIRGPALLDHDAGIRVGLNGQAVIGRQIVDLTRLSVPALLHYEDRMSMAVAREIRLPFLDYRLVSLLVPLPIEYKLRDGWTKWIFRRAMETLLPKGIAWRKDKRHFTVPQTNWFRRELREVLLNLLEDEWVTELHGLVNRRKFRRRYEAYLRQPAKTGRLSFKDIFAPLALELWARRFERNLALPG